MISITVVELNNIQMYTNATDHPNIIWQMQQRCLYTVSLRG